VVSRSNKGELIRLPTVRIWYLMHLSFVQSSFLSALHSDRQLLPVSTGQSCGCFYKTERHNPLVIEMTVSFPCPQQFNALGVQSVIGFRSYRTSQLFVAPDCWKLLDPDNQAHEEALRIAVDCIAKFINRNGGWTYVGWLRTGSVADQSETVAFKDAENIASLTQAPHISYLFPSDGCDTAINNMEFQHLRLRASELL